MDFDWFYYIGTVVLNMTEEEFWRSTPRKIGTLFKIHAKTNGWEMKSNEQNNTQNDTKYKKVNIEDIPFL